MKTNLIRRSLLLLLLLCPSLLSAEDTATYSPEFSTAGFFQMEGTGREVFSMNPAWRFLKGEANGAEKMDFNDKSWEVVSLPHGIEYLPTEASGCINYRGVVWYRKHFTPEESWKGKRLTLHFEAIMGKCKVYVNGKLLTEHFGGYLPVVMDVTDELRYGEDNVIAVLADNSNDGLYPPGKPQEYLDYTYFGGIYRDCWLVACNQVHITDPNLENVTAGGGLLVATDEVSEEKASVLLKLHVRNQEQKAFSGKVEYKLKDPRGNEVQKLVQKLNIKAREAISLNGNVLVKNPLLWTPAFPHLYTLEVRIYNRKGQVADGYRQRIGIRSFEFRGAEGFFLNGKHYDHPLIGANRHQDFAVLGNAVPNSLHWRDAKKLRDVGMEVIRNAHCPQDPAFMDACDELGLLVLDNTPGWQFWNDDPIFGERVYSDIRQLVRRDRNHACLWMWEPILNETNYPEDFARNAQQIVHEEFPYKSCYCGCDEHAKGNELFPVMFAHPVGTLHGESSVDSTKTYFTREWGDNVDDWSAHNSNSRVSRAWGEKPMLVQAEHYAKLDEVTNYDKLYRQKPQHIGGCLWHSFDHQRGYHPDPFYGGIMDNFRQPKFSYYMFMAQRPVEKRDVLYETGPMVYIAHAMTPFSDEDVQVYSNCEEVRLTFCAHGKTLTYKKEASTEGMPSPIIRFPEMYDFMADKRIARKGYGDDAFLLAEGMIDGKVVATHKVYPARRPEKIILWVDNENTPLLADGSDCVTVVAAVADNNGNIKRLNNDFIRFEVSGEGRLLGDASVLANPAPVRWGTAPVLIQSTMRPGKIKVKAQVLFEGQMRPVSGELEIESIEAAHPLVYNPQEAALISHQKTTFTSSSRSANIDREKLREVERQQTEFGE